MGKLAELGISVAVGFAVGFAVAKVTTQPVANCTTPASRTITVRANGTLDCPEAYIGMAHTITWYAPAGSRLEIGFTAPSPFPHLICYGNPRCDSYPVRADLFPTTDPAGTKKEFTYTVKLNGNPQPNGRIIIQK